MNKLVIKEILQNEKIQYDESLLQHSEFCEAIEQCNIFFDNDNNENEEVSSQIYALGSPSGRISFSTDINKKDTLIFLVSLALASFNNPALNMFKISFPIIARKVCLLNHEERCVFSIIVFLTKNNKGKTIKKSDVADYYEWTSDYNPCPFSDWFMCDRRNYEDSSLCGFTSSTFDLETILESLSKNKTISYDNKLKEINIL